MWRMETRNRDNKYLERTKCNATYANNTFKVSKLPKFVVSACRISLYNGNLSYHDSDSYIKIRHAVNNALSELVLYRENSVVSVSIYSLDKL